MTVFLTPMPKRAAEYEFTYQMQSIGIGWILGIHRGKSIHLYLVNEFNADPEFGGRAFHLQKIGSKTRYNVLVSHKPFGSRCSCFGFEAYSRCKHLLAIQDWLIDTKQEY